MRTYFLLALLICLAFHANLLTAQGEDEQMDIPEPTPEEQQYLDEFYNQAMSIKERHLAEEDDGDDYSDNEEFGQICECLVNYETDVMYELFASFKDRELAAGNAMEEKFNSRREKCRYYLEEDSNKFSESEIERIRGLSSTCPKYDELLELMELMGQMRELGGGNDEDEDGMGMGAEYHNG